MKEVLKEYYKDSGLLHGETSEFKIGGKTIEHVFVRRIKEFLASEKTLHTILIMTPFGKTEIRDVETLKKVLQAMRRPVPDQILEGTGAERTNTRVMSDEVELKENPAGTALATLKAAGISIDARPRALRIYNAYKKRLYEGDIKKSMDEDAQLMRLANKKLGEKGQKLRLESVEGYCQTAIALALQRVTEFEQPSYKTLNPAKKYELVAEPHPDLGYLRICLVEK
ncbi:hypothetical protein HZC09_03260 [Candidatus Micrarchaeota archaeon]|nr:hypothetical protein [Candidatus Micrarchaeota archaeon]